jgi:hypothetical protein
MENEYIKILPRDIIKSINDNVKNINRKMVHKFLEQNNNKANFNFQILDGLNKLTGQIKDFPKIKDVTRKLSEGMMGMLKNGYAESNRELGALKSLTESNNCEEYFYEDVLKNLRNQISKYSRHSNISRFFRKGFSI